jgi:hypothetical protein
VLENFVQTGSGTVIPAVVRSKRHILVGEIKEVSPDVGTRRWLCGCLPLAQASFNRDEKGQTLRVVYILFSRESLQRRTCLHVKGLLKKAAEREVGRDLVPG